MKGFHSGKQEPEQGWSGHSPYLAALAAALAAAAGDTAPEERSRGTEFSGENEGEMVAVYPSAYLSVTPSFFFIRRAICPFTHSSSILSLSLHLFSVLRSLSIPPSTSSLSVCRLVDKTDKGMAEYMHGYVAGWKDGGMDGWKLITYHSVIHYAPI